MKGPEKKVAARKVVAKKVVVKKIAAKKVSTKKAAPGRSAATMVEVPPAAVPGAIDATVLDRLHGTIMARRGTDPALSHSARLLGRGSAKVAQKFGEEAVECLIEAVAGNPSALIAESADVLYHLLVMWVASGVTPDQVWGELQRREGISGIMEKSGRAKRVLGTSKTP